MEAVSSNFNDGSLDGTGVSTDMAITGDGFFITQQNGIMQYTRAGNYTVSKSGELTTQDGQLVLGYRQSPAWWTPERRWGQCRSERA